MKKKKQQDLNEARREFLLRTIATSGAIGLRSFLLGLPTAFLTQRAMAAGGETYLVFSCQSEGCPVNANAPGSYLSGLAHPAQFATPATVVLGTTQVSGAAPWANLSADLRSRMQFIYHDTLTNAHNEQEKVLKMQGSLKGSTGNGQEMLPSAIAQLTAAGLGAMNTAPIVIANTRSVISAQSIPLSMVSPGSISKLFTGSITTTTTNLRRFRDTAIDTLYKDLKTNGTAAQKKFLDDHANSASQSRNLATAFQSSLSGLGAGDASDQAIAAAALLAANVTPAVVMSLTFGLDNHFESGAEESQTAASIAGIEKLWTQLKALGIQDKTTFCLLNVFGRTFGPKSGSNGGRDHYGAGSVAVVFGPKIKPGVTGGLTLIGGQRGAESAAINSTTGSTTSADVPKDQTLASVGRTLMKACGVDETTINSRFDTKGKILRSVVS